MAQIQKGTTYATGTQVTADNLNAHVDNAILLPGAIADQVSGTAAGTDLVLVSKAGVLNKVTAASLAGLVDTTPFLRADGSIPLQTGQQLTLGTTNQLAALNAASKGYVDAVAATRLPLTGGTLTGNLTLTTAAIITLSKNPVGALEATTKQYVDNRPGLAKAWVNFNGTVVTPSTIRSSLNVSSVTKNGTGDYTVNFTTAMTDANYSAVAIGSNENGGIAYSLMGASAITTGSVKINASRPSVGNTDQSIMCVQVFGN
jgi:hypothetical protein